MATVELELSARPEDVFRVLANGWMYAHWVVGTKRVREVDGRFPRPGAGFEPELARGASAARRHTTCISVIPPHRIILHAAAWPSGLAHVSILLRPLDSKHTRISIQEQPLHGLARAFALPGLRALVRWRNFEGLLRLRQLVEPTDPALG